MFGVARQSSPLCPTVQCRLSRCSSRSAIPQVLAASRSLKVLRGRVLRGAAVAKDSNTESIVEPQLDDSGPGAPGGRGGGPGDDNWSQDDGNDGGHYFAGWIVFFLAGSPYVIDGLRKLSFGRDGVRILDLPAEPGMYKPIFAAAVLGSTSLSAPAPPPPPLPQKMSDKGGVSFLGVVAILALCAGGYYLYSRRKRGSLGGSPVNDEEIQLEGFPAQNIGTRDLDPSMFYSQGMVRSPDTPADPLPSETPEVQSPPDVSQVLSVEQSREQPIPESSEAKDVLSGLTRGQSSPENPSQPECENSSSISVVPAVISDPKQLTPDEVFVDKSSNQSAMLKQDTRNGDIYADDLPAKDSFFGVRTEENVEPCKQPDDEQRTPLELPAEGNALQHDLEMKDEFLRVGTPDVQIAAKPTAEIGSVAVPKSVSPSASPEPSPQMSPKEVVKVHDSAPFQELVNQDTRSGNVLEDDLEAKDSFFRPGSKSTDAKGSSFMDEMSDPIIQDIAEELEENLDQQAAVQVQLQTVENGVKLTIGEVRDTSVVASQLVGTAEKNEEPLPNTTPLLVEVNEDPPKAVPDVEVAEDQTDTLVTSAVDSNPPPEQTPEIEALETVAGESEVARDSQIKTADTTEASTTTKPDDTSGLVVPTKDESPPQETPPEVEEPKSPSPAGVDSVVDEVALQKTLAELGLSPAPQKFPQKFVVGIKTNKTAEAEAPTTPKKESTLETLAKSPVLNESEIKVPTVEKVVTADHKGSDDSSGSNEGHRSGSSGKGNGDSGTTTKRRKKKRGKKNKGGRTNMD